MKFFTKTDGIAFLLLLSGFVLLYGAFRFHDALYPGKDAIMGGVVIVLAYLGFIALHEAQHVRKRTKDSNSPDVMETR